jgi:hypothetical protein
MSTTSADFLLPDEPTPGVGADATAPGPTIAEVARVLLPPGAAFEAESGSALRAIVDGATDELARVDAVVHAMQATTLGDDDLGRWAEALGLESGATRARIVAALLGDVDMSRAAYDAAAAAEGLTIAGVDTYAPFEAGRSAAGEPARDDSWLHAFVVRVLRSGGAADAARVAAMQATVDSAHKRAHTRVQVQSAV